MTNPLRSVEDYELFLYTLNERHASIRRSTLTLTLTGENLTDEKVVTGRTPLATLGTPRQLQFGVSVRLGGGEGGEVPARRPG